MLKRFFLSVSVVACLVLTGCRQQSEMDQSRSSSSFVEPYDVRLAISAYRALIEGWDYLEGKEQTPATLEAVIKLERQLLFPLQEEYHKEKKTWDASVHAHYRGLESYLLRLDSIENDLSQGEDVVSCFQAYQGARSVFYQRFHEPDGRNLPPAYQQKWAYLVAKPD